MSNVLRNRAVTAGIMVLCASATFGAPVTFSASQGNLAASATFELDGSVLRVTLTNTSLFDVAAPSDVLTGVFFDIGNGSAPSLSPLSAILASGSIVLFGGTDAGGVVGGEWAVKSGLVGAPHGSHYGISSSGLGLFGPGDRFPGTNLQGPDSPDGVQYGITSAGDNSASGNAAVTGSNALIQNSVVFRLSGVGTDFNPAAAIRNVSFQYGTDLSEPNIDTPTPGTVLLGALGLGAAGLRRRR